MGPDPPWRDTTMTMNTEEDWNHTYSRSLTGARFWVLYCLDFDIYRGGDQHFTLLLLLWSVLIISVTAKLIRFSLLDVPLIYTSYLRSRCRMCLPLFSGFQLGCTPPPFSVLQLFSLHLLFILGLQGILLIRRVALEMSRSAWTVIM